MVTDKQWDLLRDIRDGSVAWVSVDGAGTLSVPGGHHWRTFDGLLAKGLITMEQDDKRFWKYHLDLTGDGLRTLDE